MKTGKWFVIMQQGENEAFLEGEHFELLIYLAIKSYCGNGKFEVALSIRDIAQRAATHRATVYRILPKLVDKKMIEIVGKATRRGGAVPVYKLSHHETVDKKKVSHHGTLKGNESVSPSNESVSPSNKSVSSVGTNRIQSNKVIKEEYEEEKNLSQKKKQRPLGETKEDRLRAFRKNQRLSPETQAKLMAHAEEVSRRPR